MVTARQRGQALVECLLVMTILMIASVWGAVRWQERVEQTRVGAMAAWLMTIEHAIGQDSDYVSTRAPDLLEQKTAQVGIDNLVLELRQRSRLPAGFSVHPPMPYELTLMPVSSVPCRGPICSRELLLVAKPAAQISRLDAHRQGLDLLMALDGKGAAVLQDSADQLRGPGIQYPNPLPGRPILPVGSVALMLWRSSHLPPYARLDEDRPVRFAADVVFDGQVAMRQPLMANGGVVLANRVSDQATCHPAGLLATLEDGSLVICKAGRWSKAGERRRRALQACDQVSSGQTFGDWYFNNKFDMDDESTKMPCECAAGLMPRFLGKAVSNFEGIVVYEGFVCES